MVLSVGVAHWRGGIRNLLRKSWRPRVQCVLLGMKSFSTHELGMVLQCQGVLSIYSKAVWPFIWWDFISFKWQIRVVSLLLSHIAFPKSFNEFQRGIHWCRAATETIVLSSVIDVPSMWFMNVLLDFGQLCYYQSIPIDGEVPNRPGSCQRASCYTVLFCNRETMLAHLQPRFFGKKKLCEYQLSICCVVAV